MKLKTKILLIVGVIIMATLLGAIGDVYKSSVGLYNTSVGIKLDYQQKEQELVSFYDAKYLTYVKKENIVNLNKDVFIAVTSLIMSNRKDGEALVWKWVQENQQIPYEEFTLFYKDLSNFVESQYGGVFEIEKQKQLLANQHNKMITTYPNNIYNSFLKIPPLKYNYGYISESTRKLFNL